MPLQNEEKRELTWYDCLLVVEKKGRTQRTTNTPAARTARRPPGVIWPEQEKEEKGLEEEETNETGTDSDFPSQLAKGCEVLQRFESVPRRCRWLDSQYHC